MKEIKKILIIGGEDWFIKLKKEINNFLDTATPEEIGETLDAANYEYYKTIDYPIIEINESINNRRKRKKY
jgi:hypothetical protein